MGKKLGVERGPLEISCICWELGHDEIISERTKNHQPLPLPDKK
jgi:hypothetical protein